MARTGERVRLSVNQPAQGWGLPDVSELWAYRELLVSFCTRDLKVRYKQAALGAGWAVLQPFLLMVVFSLFFGRVLRVPTFGVPYPLFLFPGLIVWTYLANTLAKIGIGLVEQQATATKVYFPRLLIPLSGLVVGLVDLAVASVLLAGMMLFYHVAVTPSVLLAPFFVALAVATAFSVGIWLAALNVEYRDIQHVIPFLIQVWFFVTPVFYPVQLLEKRWWFVYGLNPMAGALEGVRWALFGTLPPEGLEVFASTGVLAAILLGGLIYFHFVEDRFADVV